MNLCECGAVIVSPKAERCVPCRNRAIASGRKVTVDLAYFTARTERTDQGCWEWSGHRDTAGYGRCAASSGEGLAHRLAYRVLVNGGAAIPSGVEVSHLCHNPPCCNPEHLTVERHRQNMARAAHIQRQIAATHCPYGHPYSGDNLRVHLGKRYCRACARIRTAEHRARAKAARG